MAGRARVVAVVTALAVSVFLALTTSASAEWFADLYAGAAFTQKDDVILKGNPLGVTLENVKFEDVKFDNSAVFGGRVGYWTDYVGLGLDAFHFQPDIGSQNVTLSGTVSGPGGVFALNANGPIPHIDISVTAITLDFLFRLPLLKSDDFPNGRLQPYLVVGPGLFIAEVKGEINGEVNGQPVRLSGSETDTSFGIKAGLGVAFSVHKNVALFGEYRFTHFSPDVEVSGIEVSGIKVETNLNTHHLIGGISFRFSKHRILVSPGCVVWSGISSTERAGPSKLT